MLTFFNEENKYMKKTVIELFAGVGGFRVGFNNVKLINNHVYERRNFTFVWANQWEPSTKVQPAFDCYKARFKSADGEVSNIDIAKVDTNQIPDHTVLVGGFPCQDYSVAHSLTTEKGIEGKKGVLWWEIERILKDKEPKFLVLENVDRLLKSPSKQRGRDFGIILRSLYECGYAVEWRVINAADYGYPQKRTRVFIFGIHQSTKYYKKIKNINALSVINELGLFAHAFPIKPAATLKEYDVLKDKSTAYVDIVKVSDVFQACFEKAGLMIDGHVWTINCVPTKTEATPLGKVIFSTGVDEKYFLTANQIEKFRHLRSNKKVERTSKINGYKYLYSEGAMSEHDSLDIPGRTMLTSEGTTNRSTHIIKDPLVDRLRILTPMECERLNGFPDAWTEIGMPERKRYFMMGNALVCGVVSRVAKKLAFIIEEEP